MNEHALSGRLAAPSFTLPGTVAENATFLSGKVDEVGLCFFESDACMTYTQDDLPSSLADLPLQWHVHLPVDLPWPATGHDTRQAAITAFTILQKATFLHPHLAVLHPPEADISRQRSLLSSFTFYWQSLTQNKGPQLALENVGYADVISLGSSFLQEHGMAFCLDVGHLLGYAQNTLLQSELPEQAALVHWSAPGRQDEHLPLDSLTLPQRCTAQNLMARLPCTAIHLVEIFYWQGIPPSLTLLDCLARSALPCRG
ncbi:MAG: hypothetical protein IJD16_00015 [Desulfovibrio sp.]|nr:hypothetical protein [Desulfovibrio sp.]